ncbi:Ribonuclease T2 [Schistosoma japonicum]|nr:Ribonuclease T2 [Schistosoma japonicum]
MLQLGNSQVYVFWDYLQLKLIWPPSYCSYNHCKLNPYVKNFTVNGLWATKRPYAEQVNCPAPKQFDPQLLATIRNQLAIQWENLKDYQCPMPLWEKHWDVYGKCVSYDSLIDTIFKYFDFALQQALRLASVGIRPDSSTYIGSTEFQAALQMLYRQEVSFRCKPYKAEKLTHMYVMNGTFGHKINGTNTLDRNKIRFTRQPRNRTVDQGNLNLLQLDEVIFCFSEYLQLIDCPMYTQKITLAKMVSFLLNSLRRQNTLNS